jgi:hypothetical protein
MNPGIPFKLFMYFSNVLYTIASPTIKNMKMKIVKKVFITVVVNGLSFIVIKYWYKYIIETTTKTDTINRRKVFIDTSAFLPRKIIKLRRTIIGSKTKRIYV